MSIKIESLVNVKNSADLKYQDMMLDMEFSYTQNPQVKKINEIKDLKVDYDLNAIRNSLRNLFLTNRGEKLLNPYFGMNLGNYVFDAVTESTAKAIGDNIRQNIEIFEPRIQLQQVQVIAREDDNSFVVSLVLAVPQLKLELLKLQGVLNNSGFTFVS